MMQPVISVIMANYNGAPYLAEALRSILAQSFTQIEILLVDDYSSDDSVNIARAIAVQDARLHVLTLTQNRGPSAARNYGLRAARGAWVAVIDSDDFIHPERLRRLMNAAEGVEADIIADDQLIFDDDDTAPPRRLLGGALVAQISWITTAQYIRANRLFSNAAPLGYLKPLIRRHFLREQNVFYNEQLNIGEDFDLILHLLVRGARFCLLPEMLYFYRRHGGSISHRLSDENLQAMKTADAAFRRWAGTDDLAALKPALDARLASLCTAQVVEACIARFKARAPLQGLLLLAARPAAWRIVARLVTPTALLARLRRRKTHAPPPPGPPLICVLSRQRLIAGANGSTAYLLSICSGLRDAGFRLHLVCPSPTIMGRVPMLRVAGAGDVFEYVSIRGTWRLGSLFVTRDPGVFGRALLAVADRLLQRLGCNALAALAQPAPYAVAAPWAAEDELFIARATRGMADIVLADYGFLAPGIPYASRPGAASAVVMHDLISSRTAHFAGLDIADSMAVLDAQQEAALLAQAKLVIAIQPEEAVAVCGLLPAGPPVITVPMAMTPVAAAQPGEGAGLLFVGSGTAPNVDAVLWFLDEIWPLIRAGRATATLTLAGMVCGKLGAAARRPGVRVLGHVADLAPLYRRADVIISPLRAGSGLKIKLIEALAHGKAVVATNLTAQGVENLVGGAVILADTPSGFAGGVLHLLAHPHVRLSHARAALDIARQNFAPAADLATALRAQLAVTTHAGADFDWPFVTIVVPCLNEERYIGPCLASLTAQYAAGRHEILVLDGGSTDATRSIAAEFSARHPAVRLLANPQRLQSAALNLAAAHAQAAATIMLRADAHAHYAPDFVRDCVRALVDHGASSVVVPMLTRALPGTMWQTAIAAAQSSRLGNGGAAHRGAAAASFVDHGHHAAFDLAFFRAIGGYDPQFAQNEDAELDIRAGLAGGKVWMCAQAPVTYYPRDTLVRLAQQYYRHGTGRARTLRKHHLRPRLRQIAPVGLLGACLAGLAFAPFAPEPAALVLLYPAACLGWGVAQAVKHGRPALALAGTALITMHLAWATGFLHGLVRAQPMPISVARPEPVPAAHVA